jgi:hypothetical protein
MIYGRQQKLLINYLHETTHFIWYTMCTNVKYIRFINRENGEKKSMIIHKMISGINISVNLNILGKCNEFMNIVYRYRRKIDIDKILRDVNCNPVAFEILYMECEEIKIVMEFLFQTDIYTIKNALNISNNFKKNWSPRFKKLIYNMYTRQFITK